MGGGGDGVPLGVTVCEGVSEGVDDSVELCDALSDWVTLWEGLLVEVRLWEGDDEALSEGVCVSDGDSVPVSVCVGVVEPVCDPDGLCVCDLLPVLLGVRVDD